MCRAWAGSSSSPWLWPQLRKEREACRGEIRITLCVCVPKVGVSTYLCVHSAPLCPSASPCAPCAPGSVPCAWTGVGVGPLRGVKYTQQNQRKCRNSGVGSGLCEGMRGCSTRWVCWMFSLSWLPSSVPVDLLAQGCCCARHSQVVLVTILVVPGQLRGLEKASSAPLQRWQHLGCFPTELGRLH